MSQPWPAELRTALFHAAGNREGAISSPVKISVNYPREEILIVDNGGTYRTVMVPPCSIVLTQAQGQYAVISPFW